MNKNPFVLRALKILGLQEMLKLSEILKTKQIVMKKAVGEVVVAWKDPKEKEQAEHKEPARILPFKSKNELPELKPEAKASTETPNKEANIPNFVPGELMLWQKELTKDSDASLQKQDAFNGYKKSTEMYVVKTEINGKETMRVASTQGVLVNKKQA